MDATVSAPARLLRQPEVLNRIPIAPSTLWLWVKLGKFPRPLRLGPRCTAWLESDVEGFIKAAGQAEAA